MNELDYWMNRANQDTVNSSLITEARMNYWAAKQDLVLIESLRPTITKDGDKWCVLYGSNLQEGVAGFGDTPHLAILDFNSAFHKN